jgi:hypothetical protein
MRWPGSSSIEKARGDFSPAMDPPRRVPPEIAAGSSGRKLAFFLVPGSVGIIQRSGGAGRGEIEMAGRKSAAAAEAGYRGSREHFSRCRAVGREKGIEQWRNPRDMIPIPAPLMEDRIRSSGDQIGLGDAPIPGLRSTNRSWTEVNWIELDKNRPVGGGWN